MDYGYITVLLTSITAYHAANIITMLREVGNSRKESIEVAEL